MSEPPVAPSRASDLLPGFAQRSSAATSTLPASLALGSPETQRSAATTLQVSTPSSSEESALGILLVVLVALGAGTAVFSATGLPGAQETRRVLSAMAHDIKQLATSFASKGATGTSPTAFDASAMPSASNARATRRFECPPGTWRLSLPLAKAQPLAPAASLLDGGAPTHVRCIDEAEVSEIEYSECAACGKPRPAKPKARATTSKLSEFCVSGSAPTAAPIRCVTWKQADAFCRSRGASLPTHEELKAVGKATTAKGKDSSPEWFGDRSPGAPTELREFRCLIHE